jgi:DNA-binding NarL/FixJ family response regulator
VTDLRVAIADDQQLVRAGFRMILDAEPGFTVVGEAADGLAAVNLVTREEPDVVLMDVRMPHLDGIEATRQITASGVATRVLVVTTFDVDEYVARAVRAGASGFLLKDTPPDELLRAITVVARGDALLAPSSTRQLIEQYVSDTAAPLADGEEVVASLTGREREVLGLLARGMSNAEIADELVLGETTIKTHVGRVLAKLDVRDRVQAVVWAYEHGVVRPGTAPEE